MHDSCSHTMNLPECIEQCFEEVRHLKLVTALEAYVEQDGTSCHRQALHGHWDGMHCARRTLLSRSAHTEGRQASAVARRAVPQSGFVH